MIETKVKKCWVKFVPPNPPLVGFEVDKESLDDYYALKDQDLTGYTITLKKKKIKSRDMHNYMWALCDEIAKNRRDFTEWTKEDVYRHAVREVGLWHDIMVSNEDINNIIADWKRNGIGWFAETVFAGQTETVLRLYRGASVYDADQLYRLTNYVVDMAKETGVETITDAEMKRLKEMWS